MFGHFSIKKRTYKLPDQQTLIAVKGNASKRKKKKLHRFPSNHPSLTSAWPSVFTTGTITGPESGRPGRPGSGGGRDRTQRRGTGKAVRVGGRGSWLGELRSSTELDHEGGDEDEVDLGKNAEMYVDIQLEQKEVCREKNCNSWCILS